ncbi:MAG: hypothetical protein ACOYD7_06440 [Raoultibacter sp.]|jgi:hypothetical protein
MKTCPTCGSQCFKDMEVCFGCMHQFDERLGAVQTQEIPVQAKPCIPSPQQNPAAFSAQVPAAVENQRPTAPDDPFEIAQLELNVPGDYQAQAATHSLARKSKPRHAAPVRTDATVYQEKEAMPVIQASYRLVVSLEPV